ncbi:MAG: helix-turn-helix domain-containing protein [Alphaproteobacteria bacterium]|nr:helix-turn-helix domain-containing protein [Alphaproteobacteria bacterium]
MSTWDHNQGKGIQPQAPDRDERGSVRPGTLPCAGSCDRHHRRDAFVPSSAVSVPLPEKGETATYDVATAARILGYTPKKTRKLVRNGDLPRLPFGGRIRIPVWAIEEVLACRVPSNPLASRSSPKAAPGTSAGTMAPETAAVARALAIADKLKRRSRRT